METVTINVFLYETLRTKLQLIVWYTYYKLIKSPAVS